jgi:hypothetical protein
VEVGEYDRAGDTFGLWRGDVLADFADTPFARHRAGAAGRAAAGCVRDRIAADLARARHAAIVPKLDQLIAAHPYRENLRGLYMLALYRAGRQAEALRAFQETRRILSEELGVDPSPRPDTVHQQILSNAPELDNSPGDASRSGGRGPRGTAQFCL